MFCNVTQRIVIDLNVNKRHEKFYTAHVVMVGLQ